MRTELLTIGTELVTGATVNTNAAYLARRLSDVGLPCDRQTAVPDARSPLVSALRERLGRCDILVITGGLGPTFDDITMAAIAEALQRPLRYVPAAAAAVRRFYATRHRTLQRAALRQAYVPAGGKALPNPLGTAPGLWLMLPPRSPVTHHQSLITRHWSLVTRLVIALPGVPAEMRAIMEQQVLPRVKRLEGLPALSTRTLRTMGLVELRIEQLLRRLRLPASIQVGLYPNLAAVDIRLTARAASPLPARRKLARAERALRRVLGPAVYGTDGETLEGVVGRLLVRRRRTLAVIESCTGGLIMDSLTNVPGSSRYLRGGVVAYDNAVKCSCVGIPARLLERWGAVSAPVARAMADGGRRLLNADLGLAVTGIAGPTGATASKPVGLVYVGLAGRHGCRSLRCHFLGDRHAVKTQAAQTALDWLRRHLQNHAKEL